MQVARKAVVVDDMDFCRAFLTDYLTEQSYQVMSFPSATDFIAHCTVDGRCLCSEPCVDLLLLDNKMPGLSGLDFLKKRSDLGCKLKSEQLAMFSGSWTKKEKQQAENLGCLTFPKPYDVSAMDSWLEGLEMKNRVCAK